MVENAAFYSINYTKNDGKLRALAAIWSNKSTRIFKFIPSFRGGDKRKKMKKKNLSHTYIEWWGSNDDVK